MSKKAILSFESIKRNTSSYVKKLDITIKSSIAGISGITRRSSIAGILGITRRSSIAGIPGITHRSSIAGISGITRRLSISEMPGITRKLNIAGVLAVAGILSLASCGGNSTNENAGIKTIDITAALENAGEVKLSDYASDIKYHTIESDTSALLGRIATLAMDDNHIFIPSSDKMKTLHVFDRNGKFIRNVGTKGRAKGEFMGIRSIIPLEDRNAVMVEGGNKAVIFSLDDGKVLDDIPFDKFLTGQESTSRQFNGRIVTSYSQHIHNVSYDGKGNFYLLTMDEKNGKQWLVATDSKLEKKWNMELRQPVMKELKVKLPNGKLLKFPPAYYSGSLYLNDGECVFSHWLNDTAYIVKENCITPRLVIDYGKFRKMENAGNEDDISAHIEYESKNLIFLSMRMPELFDKFANNNGTGHMIYDKIKNRAIFLKPYEDATDSGHGYGCGAFFNDLDGGLPFWPLAIQGNSMFSFCDAGRFIELSQKYNSPKMKEIALRITEDSNPVLIEVVLK